MKANKAEQQALITLLNRIYEEIRTLEEQWDIRVDANDFRPRIEYFHDAVRALTTGGLNKRLTVEFLAYDISMLRYIQTNPMARNKGAKATGSPSTNVVVRPAKPYLSGKAETTAAKQALSDLYKNYAVLFAALLSESADRDYYSRLNEYNSEVEDLSAMEQAVKGKKNSEINMEELADQIIDDPEQMNKVLIAARKAKKGRLLASEALRLFKEMMQAADKGIKVIDQAHFTFATGQLAVYENARDVVKKMATQGMNIVGSFVENAVQEASRKGGREL